MFRGRGMPGAVRLLLGGGTDDVFKFPADLPEPTLPVELHDCGWWFKGGLPAWFERRGRICDEVWGIRLDDILGRADWSVVVVVSPTCFRVLWLVS